jgi:molybdate transport system regulatory protein
MQNPVIRFRIDFAAHSSVGPGKIGLLEAIRNSGSISQAARDLGMSYRRAWLLIDSVKMAFCKPVTTATTGGKGGGGVALTEFGEGLIESYRALERDIAGLAQRRLRTVSAAVARQSESKAAAARRPLGRRPAHR